MLREVKAKGYKISHRGRKSISKLKHPRDTVNLRVKTALPLVVKLHDAVMLKTTINSNTNFVVKLIN